MLTKHMRIHWSRHRCMASLLAWCATFYMPIAAVDAAPGVDPIGPASSVTAERSQAEAYLERLLAESGSPGVSAAVMVKGRIVFSGGVGIADLESGEPLTASTVHNIGSISKTQAAVAVMELVEQGKVNLDSEIQTYAPWFPRKQAPITVRQLLTHTSGIRHYKEGEFGPGGALALRHYDTFEESTRFWRDDPLLFQPGTHWYYSSYGVNLLQAVVETASGQSYEDYLTQHVWRPAGMVHTELDLPARIVPHRGRGYALNEKLGRLENATYMDLSYKYAGAGVLSTDEDMCRFGHALNSGILLKPAALSELYRLQLPRDLPRFEASLPSARPIASIQALIFQIRADPQGRLYAGHSGSVKGTESRFINYYRDDVTVAIHFNRKSADSAVDVAAAAETLAALYFPLGQPQARSSAAPRK